MICNLCFFIGEKSVEDVCDNSEGTVDVDVDVLLCVEWLYLAVLSR